MLALPAIISMLASSRSKRLGDIFAGTVVLQESVPRTTGSAPSMPPGLESWAALLDLTMLDDELAFVVRRFLSRAWEMSPQAREAIGTQLVAAVGGVVTPAPPYGTQGWAYLSAVLAERTRRAYLRLVATVQADGAAPLGLPGMPPNPQFPARPVFQARPPSPAYPAYNADPAQAPFPARPVYPAQPPYPARPPYPTQPPYPAQPPYPTRNAGPT
jgi:hypothetical protein